MEPFLSPESRKLVESIDGLALESLRTHYYFVREDVYEQVLHADAGKGMLIYWFEHLQNAHFTAITSLLRNRHWLSAMLSATDDKNLLAFAAALRGLIESAADSDTALFGLPRTLVAEYQRIHESLAGNATSLVVSTDLEKSFIHYSHARYLTRSEAASLPTEYKALKTQDYLKIFGDKSEHGIQECYRFACDLLHPAAPSVQMWVHVGDGKESSFSLLPHQDESIILSFSENHAAGIENLMTFAFVAPLLVLNILNYFPIEHIHTPQLSKWNFDENLVWSKCRDELKKYNASPLV